MMKKVILLLSLTLLLGSTAAFAQKPSQEDINASKTIELTNTVIDLSNQYNGRYKNYTSLLNSGEKMYERMKKGENTQYATAFSGGPSSIGASYRTKYEKALEGTPAGVKEKEEISAAVAIALSNIDSLEEWAQYMRDYFREKKFEGDDFAGYFTSKDSITYYLEAAQESWSKAAAIVSEAGDKAEAHLMKGDPVADFFLPMKADLKETRKIVDKFYTMVEAEDYNFTDLKEQLTSFMAGTAEHRSLENKDTSVLKSEGRFTEFYKTIDSWSESLSSLIEELSKDKPSSNMIQSLNSRMNMYYGQITDKYNNFAQYGTK